jgi:hypothetical protein
MGVLTTAYALPPAMMKKVEADPESLNYLFGIEEGEADGEADAWKCESYEFDKGFEEAIGILGDSGYAETRDALDLENQDEDGLEFDGYGLRVVPPAMVKKIAKELAPATFEDLKAKGVALGITDYYGKLIPEARYAYYVGDIEVMKAFFEKAAAAGHYVLIAAA